MVAYGGTTVCARASTMTNLNFVRDVYLLTKRSSAYALISSKLQANLLAYSRTLISHTPGVRARYGYMTFQRVCAIRKVSKIEY